jgi:hypothetical protein
VLREAGNREGTWDGPEGDDELLVLHLQLPFGGDDVDAAILLVQRGRAAEEELRVRA